MGIYKCDHIMMNKCSYIKFLILLFKTHNFTLACIIVIIGCSWTSSNSTDNRACNEHPEVLYFGNPRHTQSMIEYKILTEYFWKFQ